MKCILVVGAVLAATLSSAFADGDRFADAVEDYTRDDHRAWVVNRLMKFNLGAKCWAKVVEPKSGAVGAASYVTDDVVVYAKEAGGGDWAALEQDKRALGAAMDKFRNRFFVTVSVDGDDCDAARDTAWIRYWEATVAAMTKTPAAGGKMFVTIDVSTKHKGLSVEVGSDGATVTIRAPKDKATDSELIEQTFQKLRDGVPTTSGGLDAFAFAANKEHAGLVITKLHTFKIGKKCLAKLSDPKQSAIYWSGWVISAIADWAARTGSEDWSKIISETRDRARAHAEIATDIAALRKRFSVTVVVEGDDCDASMESAWLGYWKTTLGMLEALPPKSTKIAVTITATSRAKDVAIAVGKDGSSYAVTGPASRAPRDYAATIEAAFMKVAKNRGTVAARKKNNADSKVVKAGGNPFPDHGRPLSDTRIRSIPNYERDATYTKGAEVATQMSSNPHTLVYRCKETKCTDSPGSSRQWQSVGWANAD